MSADRIELFDYIEQIRCAALNVHHPSGTLSTFDKYHDDEGDEASDN